MLKLSANAFRRSEVFKALKFEYIVAKEAAKCSWNGRDCF